MSATQENANISPAGTDWCESDTLHVSGSQADFANAKKHFPERDIGDWGALFDRQPEVLHKILGDIFRETKAEQDREAGRARIGRRPKHINGSLDELHQMITPQYAQEPFAAAVKVLIDKAPSLRAFAAKVPMHHHTLTRMMRGDLVLERWRLEAIAKAGKVQPAYFMEYREMMIVEALTSYLRARPNVSIGVHKRLARKT